MSEDADRTADHAPNHGPLAGVRVIELSHILSAPTCGLMLADLGAEVIKVERPPRGETTRYDTVAEDWIGDQTASFMTVNRNKRSLALDLKASAGKEIEEICFNWAPIGQDNLQVGRCVQQQIHQGSAGGRLREGVGVI